VVARAPAPARPPRSFQSPVVGTIHQTQALDGILRVVIRLTLNGGPQGQLRIDLHGSPINGGVSMASSGVSFVPATTRAVYLGSVTGLAGSVVAATVRDHAGDTLQLTARLSLDVRSGRASGQVAAAPGAAG
jgi:hypothetical protein